MGGYETRKTEKDTAVLVALINKNQPEEKVIEYLDELAFLAETLGLNVVKTFTQRMDRPEIKTFVGKGKLEEIGAFVKVEEVNTVIFDDDLSPSQMRNLEKKLLNTKSMKTGQFKEDCMVLMQTEVTLSYA